MRNEKDNLQVIMAQAEELKEAQKEDCCNLFHRNTHKDGRKATLCSQQYWQGNCSGYLSLVHQGLRKLYIADLCLCAKARPSLCLSHPSSNQAKRFHQIVIIIGSILLTCHQHLINVTKLHIDACRLEQLPFYICISVSLKIDFVVPETKRINRTAKHKGHLENEHSKSNLKQMKYSIESILRKYIKHFSQF